jgi:hypothetical protein
MTKWYYRRKVKEIYKSLAYVMMLEYLPERLIAMQLHPTNLHDPTLHALVFILSMQKYILENVRK